jgi:hypothetical protein
VKGLKTLCDPDPTRTLSTPDRHATRQEQHMGLLAGQFLATGIKKARHHGRASCRPPILIIVLHGRRGERTRKNRLRDWQHASYWSLVQCRPRRRHAGRLHLTHEQPAGFNPQIERQGVPAPVIPCRMRSVPGTCPAAVSPAVTGPGTHLAHPCRECCIWRSMCTGRLPPGNAGRFLMY